MSIFVPITIFIASLAAAFWLVWRKFPYLTKLSPEVLGEDSNKSFLDEMYPEVYSFFGSVFSRENKIRLMNFSERILRKLRLLVLRIEAFFHSVINSLRHSLKREVAKAEEEQTNIIEKETSEMVYVDPDVELRKNEQELIISIAKDPKNAELYETLGDIYMKTKEYNDAVQSYEKAFELNNTNRILKKKLEGSRLMLEKEGGMSG